MEITREIASKVLEVVDAGLVEGVGEPTWIETGPGRYTVNVREGADFGVIQDGRDFLVTIPGFRIVRCWNTAQVNRWCENYVEDVLDCPDEPREDEEAADRSYSEARRFERAATPVRL